MRKLNWKDSYFCQTFNFKSDLGTGRCMLLLNTLMGAVGNIFITGTFYTAFLVENGIDIVRVGIMTFIPYLCWAFGLFAPKILSHFKKRRLILLLNHIFYFACIILGTTVAPLLVESPGARTFWFAFFLILGNVSNALVGSGAIAWHVNFIGTGKQRNYYFSITYLVTNLIGMFVSVGAALAVDALAGTPAHRTVLFALRFVSYVLMTLGGILLLLIPKEYPYVNTLSKIKLRDVFTVPLRSKKFLLTTVVVFMWSFVCNINANTWTYYILNTLNTPYTVTYVGSVACALTSIFLMGIWRSFINQAGWSRSTCFCVILYALVELGNFFVTEHTLWLFVLLCIVANINLVGMQINVANAFYINKPAEDTDIYITFFNFSCNISNFLGAMFGTWLIAVLELPNGAYRSLFGMPVYASQLLVLLKAILLAGMAFYIWRVTPKIIPDHD